MTDQELLRAYTDSSDMESLGAFFGRYQESLLRFVGKFLGDGERAQDVVQETFLQVARHPRKLIEVDSCHNWLLTVARNIGITHLRRDARARRHAERAGERRVAEAEETAAASAATLEREETRWRVRGEIDKLSPRHRELVLLKVVEQKSYKEIAQITGLSTTNVGYLLHNAMKELTRRIEGRKEDFA